MGKGADPLGSRALPDSASSRTEPEAHLLGGARAVGAQDPMDCVTAADHQMTADYEVEVI